METMKNKFLLTLAVAATTAMFGSAYARRRRARARLNKASEPTPVETVSVEDSPQP